jgi:hypothetical protein
MTRFFSADFARNLAAMTAALLLSTTFVAAAVAPSNVAAPVAQVA